MRSLLLRNAMEVIDFLIGPWPWWFSGLVIAGVMFVLIYFGQTFGFSHNLHTLCAAVGMGKKYSFFDFDWRSQRWNLAFLVGALLGGMLTKLFLSSNDAILLSEKTVMALAELGFSAPTSMQPDELYGWNNVFTLKGFLLLAAGGFMVGFGSRWAGGCTSGHAISGLSDLQVPSLLAVIGFFVGGLIMTHLLFPILF